MLKIQHIIYLSTYSGPKVLFKTCVAMKFVDDDDDDIYKGIQNCAISWTLADQIVVETLHVNRVDHVHENSQGPMSIALC